MDREIVQKYIEEYGKDIYSFCVYLTRSSEKADDSDAIKNTLFAGLPSKEGICIYYWLSKFL